MFYGKHFMLRFGHKTKQLICLILALATAVCICGCGVNENPSGETALPTAVSSPSPSPSAEPEEAFDVSPYEGLVFSKVYGNSAKKDCATSAGFIELYNGRSEAVDCSELAIYYKSPSMAGYKQYLFNETSIGPGSYYLIKCAHNNSYDASSEIISVDRYDSFWNMEINAGDVSLILGSAAVQPSSGTVPEDFAHAVSYFHATDNYTFDTGCTKALSKTKYAVRVSLIPDSGWEVVDLSASTSVKLRGIVPYCSEGVAGSVKRSVLNEVDFDYAPGFYDEGFYLSLSAAEGSSVYYTLDGSDPRTSSERKLYNSPIYLKDTTSVKVGQFVRDAAAFVNVNPPSSTKKMPGGYVVRACSEKDGTVSEVYTASYFVSSLYKNFNVTVMSVSMELDEFAGEKGFYNNYYASENIQNPRGAGVMEVFGKDGSREGYANIELSVSGHGSSGAPMKSMKVFYRKSDNETGGTEDKLYYDLFGGYSVNEKGQRITDFARLLLRNSGNDYGMTYIRDAYMQRVSRVLNVDTMAYAPALVFFNGCFWGVYNVRERYSGDYVESHHGIDKDNVALIESDYSQVHTNQNAPFVLTSGLDYDPDAFNTLVEYIRSRDLSVQKYFDYVADRLDLTSFVDMYVARMFFNSVDWPENNIKIWRNRAGAGDPSNYDTKWHFTLLDTDFGAGFYDNITAYNLTIWGAMDATNCVVGTIMHRLLKNEAFREKFVLRFCEVVEDLFGPEYLEAELDAIVAEREPFIYLQTTRWGANQDSYKNGVEIIRNFVRKRQDIALNSFLEVMGYTKAQINSLRSNAACITYKYSAIEIVYANGRSVLSNDTVPIPEGGLELTLEIKVRSKYKLASVVLEDFKGNAIYTVPAEELQAQFIKLKIENPLKVVISCEKAG